MACGRSGSGIWTSSRRQRLVPTRPVIRRVSGGEWQCRFVVGGLRAVVAARRCVRRRESQCGDGFTPIAHRNAVGPTALWNLRPIVAAGFRLHVITLHAPGIGNRRAGFRSRAEKSSCTRPVNQLTTAALNPNTSTQHSCTLHTGQSECPSAHKMRQRDRNACRTRGMWRGARWAIVLRRGRSFAVFCASNIVRVKRTF